jgi:hypothetical protein
VAIQKHGQRTDEGGIDRRADGTEGASARDPLRGSCRRGRLNSSRLTNSLIQGAAFVEKSILVCAACFWSAYHFCQTSELAG